MPTHTVTFTFGTPDKWASASMACPSLGEAADAAQSFVDHGGRLLSVDIRDGDHAPRLYYGAWVPAPEGGWTTL